MLCFCLLLFLALVVVIGNHHIDVFGCVCVIQGY